MFGTIQLVLPFVDGSILEVAARVTTPLALAGVTLAFLYLLYRPLLRGRLLTALGSTHSFRVVNRVVTYLFALALVAIVLAISAFMIARVADSMLTIRAAR